MTEEHDKIAQYLQEAILEGYSEKFKDEFIRPENIGRIKDPDSWAVDVKGKDQNRKKSAGRSCATKHGQVVDEIGSPAH